MLRFDWFIKSRTAMELQRRCNTLIMLIEKVIIMFMMLIILVIIMFIMLKEKVPVTNMFMMFIKL